MGEPLHLSKLSATPIASSSPALPSESSIIWEALKAWFLGGLIEELIADSSSTTTPPSSAAPLAGLHLEGLSSTPGYTGIVGPSPSKTLGLSAVKNTATGPRGWLGFLAGHGAACFGYEQLYVQKQVYALSPRIKATWHSHGGGFVELNHSDVDCLARRTAETQCPAWGTGYSPVLAGQMPKSPKMCDDDMVNLIGGVSEGDGLNYVESRLRWRDYGSGPVGTRPAGNVAHHWDNIRPQDATHEGRIIDAARSWLLAHSSAKIAAPPWAKPGGLREEWERRISRWFDVAQYLVWAAEMARLHGQVPIYLPAWWAEYANAWGVSVAPGALALNRRLYNTNTVYTEHRDIAKAKLLVGLPTLTPMAWERIARALMTATSKPGDPLFLGQQIAAPDKTRHILDLPPMAQSLVPSLKADGEIYASVVGRWCQRQDFDELATQILAVYMKVMSFVVGAFTGGAAAAAWAAMETAYAAAASVLKAIAGIANNEPLLGEVWDIVSGISNCIVAVSDASGRDVAGLIPDGAWEALTKVGAVIPSWGGDVAELVAQDAIVLQQNLCALRDVYRWPYLEEGFSTIVGAKD